MTSLSYQPRSGTFSPAPADSSVHDVDTAAREALAAAPAVEATAPAARAGWLAAVADALDSANGRLVEIADEETALGVNRLRSELERAAESLRFYGEVAAEGSWLDATIDERNGARPDLRRANRSLGPVAMFGASNFPFGFGVLGHDTGSALAAGCPVVVKAHPAHPRLSAALADVAARALHRQGAPTGTFALVFGYAAGAGLVTHPAIAAVAFTGSESGGLALWRLAATRERHIPVYAEMGTVNAVVVTPAAAKVRAEEIAAGFVASFTLGMGQFCTKPGLLLVPSGSGLTARVGSALQRATPDGWMLTSGIADAYSEGVRRLLDAGATIVAVTPERTTGWAAAPAVLAVGPELLRVDSPLLAEVFGPVALIAEYRSDAELHAVLDALPGSVATGVQIAPDGDEHVAALVQRLSRKAGRVVVDGWPTGVAVTWAQHHGGPWPATTDPTATSVGSAALSRFVRPVAYQDVPDYALPPALQQANPWRLTRRVNGGRSA
jgi:NADP-dependent aldehyde dehydrogenase